MRHIFLIICLLIAFGAYATEEELFPDEENFCHFQHVNVISGHLELGMHDIEVAGPVPLSIDRSYSSWGALENRSFNIEKYMKGHGTATPVQEGWGLLKKLDLVVFRDSCRAYVYQDGWGWVCYDLVDSKKRRWIFKPANMGPPCYGHSSGRSNLQNSRLEMQRHKIVLYLPNGETRVYLLRKGTSWDLYALYLLTEETLPSGHRRLYSYTSRHKLIGIKTLSPNDNKVFSWLKIDRHQAKAPYHFTVTTSDGKALEYQSIFFKHHGDYLSEVQGPSRVKEQIAYTTSRKGLGRRLESFCLDDNLQVQVTYYGPPDVKTERAWHDASHKVSFEADKVKTLRAPLGPGGEMVEIAHFSYFRDHTDVYDSERCLTRFHHQGQKLTHVEYFDPQGIKKSSVSFFWAGHRLVAKAFLDGEGRAFYAKRVEHDAAGNVITETLYGNFSGQTPGPFTLHGDGSLEGAGTVVKKSTYYPDSHLTKSEAEGRLRYEYTYLPGTDLLTSKLTYSGHDLLKREFKEYDADHLLVTEIVDDGKNLHSAHLEGVTLRQIVRYQHDAMGMPISREEYGLDLDTCSEILCKKSLYYYENGRVVEEQVFDSQGVYRYTLHVAYSAHGKVVMKTDPMGRVSHYSYDAQNRLLTSQEAGEKKKSYTYNLGGAVTSVLQEDAIGHVTAILSEYDVKGRMIRQVDEKGHVLVQEYDSSGNCLKTCLPAVEDARGNLVRPVLTFGYDAFGNLIESTGPCGETKRMAYTLLKKPYLQIEADGSTNRHIYDTEGLLRETIFSDGTVEERDYDPFKRMLSRKLYDTDRKVLLSESWFYSTFCLLAHTGPTGLVTTYEYDAFGRKIGEATGPYYKRYVYDALGHVERVCALTTEVKLHDLSGRVIEQWEEGSAIENRMTFYYNEEGRKERAIRDTSVGPVEDLFAFDGQGRLIRHTDPLGAVTETIYHDDYVNALGQNVLQKSMKDPTGNSVQETYNALGHLVERCHLDPEGMLVGHETFTYDLSGNKMRWVSHIFGRERPSYREVSWEYDARGRRTTQVEDGEKITRYAYDSKSRLISKVMPSGIRLTYHYDGLDRLRRIQSSDASVDEEYIYEKDKDPTVLLDHVHDTQLRRTYDAFGHLIEEENPSGYTLRWEYDLWGRCTHFILHDGSSIAYTYEDKHLKRVDRLNAAGSSCYHHTYAAFDVNGHVTQEILLHGAGTLTTEHDALERPTKQKSPVHEQEVHYNPSGLVVHLANTLFGSKAMSYDALNQLHKEGDREYHFDSLGNPLDATIGTANCLLNRDGQTIHYDADGNPLKIESPKGTTFYAYDALGRLTSLISKDRQLRYAYDPLSRLLYAETLLQQEGFWVPIKERYFLYDRDFEIGTLDAQGDIVELKVLGLGVKGDIGGAVAIESGNEIFAPLHDFQGNLIALIDGAGSVAECYDLQAFGQEVLSTDSPKSPWRFASKRAEENLVFFGLRFYHPDLGRFLTPDPSGFSDGANLYLFVCNSPLNRLDLFGLWSSPIRIEVPISDDLKAGKLMPCMFFTSTGRTMQGLVGSPAFSTLAFTPKEMEMKKFNIEDHFHELFANKGSSIGLITYQNGMNTSFKKFSVAANYLHSNATEGTLFLGMHLPTTGLLPIDSMLALADIAYKNYTFSSIERDDYLSHDVTATQQVFAGLSEGLHHINPDAKWLHFAYSRGGIVGFNAIMDMEGQDRERLQQQMVWCGIGPASPMKTEWVFDAVDVYSEDDYMTKWQAPRKGETGYNVQYLKSISPCSDKLLLFIDHGIMAPTYKSYIKDYFDNLRKKYEFFNPTAR